MTDGFNTNDGQFHPYQPGEGVTVPRPWNERPKYTPSPNRPSQRELLARNPGPSWKLGMQFGDDSGQARAPLPPGHPGIAPRYSRNGTRLDADRGTPDPWMDQPIEAPTYDRSNRRTDSGRRSEMERSRVTGPDPRGFPQAVGQPAVVHREPTEAEVRRSRNHARDWVRDNF